MKSFSYFQDRDALSLKLEDTENWLYEDGEDQPKQVYIDKLTELKVIVSIVTTFCTPLLGWDTNFYNWRVCLCLQQKLGQPIKERYTEAEMRPKAFEELGKQIQQYMKFVEAFKMKVRLNALEEEKLKSKNADLFEYNKSNNACNIILCCFSYDIQDEQYDHLDEADVKKVDKLTSDAMMWMNSSMNQQSKQNLTVDPSVKVKDIEAKTRVSVFSMRTT